MPTSLLGTALAACLLAPAARAADEYTVDPAHTSARLRNSHLGLAWIYGRFNEVAGRFTVDPAEPSKTSFELTIKADSLDTANAKRDEHLRSPDFFNVKQFPQIGF